MKIDVVSSGSNGNCYVLQNENEALIIDCGIKFSEVQKYLDYNIMKIVGCVVSHTHCDHARYISDYEKAGIKVYKPYENEEDANKTIKFGGFTIKAFDLVHDVPCYGFFISHKDIGKMIYASDTEYIKYKFKGINHMLVEANYSLEYVDTQAENYEHILNGHMSIEQTCDFIQANKTDALKNVILCHLSMVNSNSDNFIEKVSEVANCNVYVARKGMSVDLSQVPF